MPARIRNTSTSLGAPAGRQFHHPTVGVVGASWVRVEEASDIDGARMVHHHAVSSCEIDVSHSLLRRNDPTPRPCATVGRNRLYHGGQLSRLARALQPRRKAAPGATNPSTDERCTNTANSLPKKQKLPARRARHSAAPIIFRDFEFRIGIASVRPSVGMPHRSERTGPLRISLEFLAFARSGLRFGGRGSLLGPLGRLVVKAVEAARHVILFDNRKVSAVVLVETQLARLFIRHRRGPTTEIYGPERTDLRIAVRAALQAHSVGLRGLVDTGGRGSDGPGRGGRVVSPGRGRRLGSPRRGGRLRSHGAELVRAERKDTHDNRCSHNGKEDFALPGQS